MPNIQMVQHAMYATAPKTQLRPEPGTPGASGFGNLATLEIETVSTNAAKAAIREVEMNSLDHDVHSIEVEKGLERHVGEHDEGK